MEPLVRWFTVPIKSDNLPIVVFQIPTGLSCLVPPKMIYSSKLSFCTPKSHRRSPTLMFGTPNSQAFSPSFSAAKWLCRSSSGGWKRRSQCWKQRGGDFRGGCCTSQSFPFLPVLFYSLHIATPRTLKLSNHQSEPHFAELSPSSGSRCWFSKYENPNWAKFISLGDVGTGGSSHTPEYGGFLK